MFEVHLEPVYQGERITTRITCTSEISITYLLGRTKNKRVRNKIIMIVVGCVRRKYRRGVR